jgi:hypothetical protein
MLACAFWPSDDPPGERIPGDEGRRGRQPMGPGRQPWRATAERPPEVAVWRLPAPSTAVTVHVSGTTSSTVILPSVMGPMVACHTPLGADIGPPPLCTPAVQLTVTAATPTSSVTVADTTVANG